VPEDRGRWTVQNAFAKWLDPPHVYNVFNAGELGFKAAVRGALENPISG
jgi:hypothetical protein